MQTDTRIRRYYLKFLLKLVLLMFSQVVCQAQDVEMKLLEQFSKSGNPEPLFRLYKYRHLIDAGDGVFKPVLEHTIQEFRDRPFIVKEREAEIPLRALMLIGARRAQLEIDREPIAKIVHGFLARLKLPHQPDIIRPGQTRPEEVSDPAYRAEYIKYLAAMRTDHLHATLASALHGLEQTFRSDSITALGYLQPDQRFTLIKRLAPSTISRDVIELLEAEFSIPFVFKDGKPLTPAKP